MIDHQAVRRDYLLEIANRLRRPGGEDIVARALLVIAKWEASSGVHPRYIAEWRNILADGAGAADAVQELAASRTPEAMELQHCMPFAGILTNRERQAIRAKH